MARVIHTRKPTIPAIRPRTRVAAYARVSIEKESMIESLAAQVGYYRTHIQHNPEWKYVGVYADVDTPNGQNPKVCYLLMQCTDAAMEFIIR